MLIYKIIIALNEQVNLGFTAIDFAGILRRYLTIKSSGIFNFPNISDRFKNCIIFGLVQFSSVILHFLAPACTDTDILNLKLTRIGPNFLFNQLKT